MAQVNISRHIAAIRSASFPQSNFLALALQQLQDAVNQAATSAAGAATAAAAASSSSSSATVATAATASAAPAINGVQGGQITGPSIAPNAVTTGAIAPNAVTTGAIAPNAVTAEATQLQASVALTTTLTQVATVAVGTGGGVVLLSAAAQLRNAASAQVVRLQVYKGDNTGTLMLDTGASGIAPASGSDISWASGLLLDSSPGTSQQYTIYGSIAAGTGTLVNLLLTAVNLKR